jgi:hypothetical protein
VVSKKEKLQFNMCHWVGFQTYQLAKLRMLQMQHDFMHRYWPREAYELVEMDTDSLYFASATKNLHGLSKLVARKRKHLFSEYRYAKRQFLTRRSDFAAHDNRKPGLFKEEWTGEGMVALGSKCYFGVGDKCKLTCKGVNKRQNPLDETDFMQVLRTKRPKFAVNKGFRVIRGSKGHRTQAEVKQYQLTKLGLTYGYYKRKVLPCGIKTVPLDL